MTDEPAKYKITCLNDLLDIPEDRIDAFCDELKDILKTSHRVMSVNALTQKAFGMDVISGFADGFTWVDDGKHNKTITLTQEANHD